MSKIETPELLASPDLSTPWVPLWPLAPITSGELAYAEGATDFSIPVVAQASAATVLTLPAVTLDGATPIYVEFAAPLLFTGAGSSHSIFNLWDGSTDLKALGQFQNPDLYTAVFVRRRLTPSAGVHTYSIRGYATSAAGTLLSAAAGPRLPYHARIVLAAPVSTAPQGALLPVQYGTSLPTSPVDGQEAILVDSLTNPSYQWRFRYNAGSTSPYKWEFIGGTSATNAVNAEDGATPSSGAYINLPGGAGPQLTIPRSGEYEVTINAKLRADGSGGGHKIGLKLGAAAVAITETVGGYMGAAEGGASLTMKRAAVANDVWLVQYMIAQTSNCWFANRALFVRPVRVS